MSELHRYLTAVRRAGHEAATDLRKRRVWYADEPPTPTPATPPPPATSAPEPQPSGADDSGEGDALPSWVKDPAKAYEEIQKLRKENEDKRKSAREAQQRLDKLESERQQREEDKLKEEKKFEDLANSYKAKYEQVLADLATQQLNTLKLQIGTDFKLTPKLISRLQGTTEDELRADAAEIAKELGLDKQQSDQQQQPPQAQNTQARSQQTTTAVPGGQPVGRTDTERNSEYFGSSNTSPMFQKTQVVYHGSKGDLDQPI